MEASVKDAIRQRKSVRTFEGGPLRPEYRQKLEQAFYANGEMRVVERQIQEANAVTGELPEQPIQEANAVTGELPEQPIQQLESSPKLMDAMAEKRMDQYGEQLLAQFAVRLIRNKKA